MKTIKTWLPRFILGGLVIIFILTIGIARDIKADSITPITIGTIDNIKIRLGDEIITFKNGEYNNQKQVPLQESGVIDNKTFGDLNGDNEVDAAFDFTKFAGASGNAHYLCVAIAAPGGPRVLKPFYLGDGVQVKKLKIQSGKIIMDIVTHGPNDGHNFPTLKKTVSFIVKNDSLVPLSPYNPSFVGENLLK
jgi:hypothetical protein